LSHGALCKERLSFYEAAPSTSAFAVLQMKKVLLLGFLNAFLALKDGDFCNQRTTFRPEQ
jgi:hypothetical protein